MVTFTAKIPTQSSVMQFVMCILHSVTNGHILHLKTPSYAEHKALETFYTEAGDLIDAFVEAYQGKYTLLTDYTSEFELAGEPIPYLTYLQDEVIDLRKQPDFPQDSELQNEVDNIANLINSTLYKLRFLN